MFNAHRQNSYALMPSNDYATAFTVTTLGGSQYGCISQGTVDNAPIGNCEVPVGCQGVTTPFSVYLYDGGSSACFTNCFAS